MIVHLNAFDISRLFVLETSFAELVLRGSFLYLSILIFLRILPRRTGGELAMMDLIFLILIAEGASHALGDYTSLTEGIIVIVTLMGWKYVVNALSYYFPAFEKLVSSPPIQVIKDGRLLRRNMRREYLTETELVEHLRKEGIEDIQEIKAAFVESEGAITIIARKKQE